MTQTPLPAGTLVRLTERQSGTPYPVVKGGYKHRDIPAGSWGMIHVRTGGMKTVINPFTGWSMPLDTRVIEPIGRVVLVGTRSALVFLNGETLAHSYTYPEPRTPQQAAQVRLWAWEQYLSGDLGQLQPPPLD